VTDKVTWQQAGQVTKPGRYMFRFGWLTVTAEDLAIWKQFPNTEFTLVRTSTATTGVVATTDFGEEFHLGAFELRENPLVSEK
jgi:hypothetical protein